MVSSSTTGLELTPEFDEMGMMFFLLNIVATVARMALRLRAMFDDLDSIADAIGVPMDESLSLVVR